MKTLLSVMALVLFLSVGCASAAVAATYTNSGNVAYINPYNPGMFERYTNHGSLTAVGHGWYQPNSGSEPRLGLRLSGPDVLLTNTGTITAKGLSDAILGPGGYGIAIFGNMDEQPTAFQTISGKSTILNAGFIFVYGEKGGVQQPLIDNPRHCREQPHSVRDL